VNNLLKIIVIVLLGFPTTLSADSNTESAGDVLRIILPLTAYGTTFYLNDKDGRNQFYKSFFTNLGVTYGLKALVDKERPDGTGNDAFPSGHASVAFQSAAFIQMRYGWKYGLPAYATATFVGWSRLQSDPAPHDNEDVIAGAMIGVLSSYFFTTPYKNVTVTSFMENGIYGVNLQMRW
jgi:membrane-associated phospholipid phosphatase